MNDDLTVLTTLNNATLENRIPVLTITDATYGCLTKHISVDETDFFSLRLEDIDIADRIDCKQNPALSEVWPVAKSLDLDRPVGAIVVIISQAIDAYSNEISSLVGKLGSVYLLDRNYFLV